MHRRYLPLISTFLLTFAASLPLLAADTVSMQMPTKPGIAVQLWSVKDDLQADYRGTLDALAGMGFRGIEFAGNFGPWADDPEGLKTYLDSIGLQAVGAHVGFAGLSDENFDTTVAFYSALGCTDLVVPKDRRAFDPDQVDQVIEDLNRLSARLEPLGMRTGYHNHAEEFADFGDSTFWDYIARKTDDRVIMQLDVGHAVYAGKDPAAYVRRYPGRTISTHYKGRLPEGTNHRQPFIGQDTIDWPELIRANREVGGTQWLILEQEEYPDGMSQLDAVEESLAGLLRFVAHDNRD